MLVFRTDKLLIAQGYKLIEDAWEQSGRLTYLHDEDADRNFIKRLATHLRPAGWQTNFGKLRSLCHATQHELELEPGGAEVKGHFLHLIKTKQA